MLTMTTNKKEEAKRAAFLERKKRNQRAHRERKKLAEKGEPLRAYGPAECGSASMYRKGCRCDWCTKANTLEQRLYNEKRKLRDADSGDGKAGEGDV